MAPIFTPVSAIVAGKINIKLHVRVINLWSVPEFNKPSEISAIHMLLLDEKLGKIQATAKKNLVPKILESVKEGSCYEIENVLVTHNDPKYQTTHHRFKLNLIGNTKFTKIDESTIPLNHFDFVSFKDILECDREEKYVDVIGHVVEKDVLKDKEFNGKKSKLIDLTLEDVESTRIHCSLWGKYAEKMHAFLNTHNSSSPVVVILQLCKLKKYYGAMGISNAFYTTKLILDGDDPAIIEYRSKIDGTDVEVTQGVSQMTGTQLVPLGDDMLQTRRMTIEDLIESSDHGNGIVLATICGIESEYNWYYEACIKCAARVKTVSGKLYCPRCKMGRNAVPRFKVHVQVMDMTGSTSFIMFDRNVSNFVGRSVQDLIEAQSQKTNAEEYPSELDILVGKQMLFKIEITDGNLLHNWRNYGVKRTCDDVELIKKFTTLHKINLCNEEDGAIIESVALSLCDEVPLEKRLIEYGDSNKTEVIQKDDEQTPCSKVLTKRSADSVGSATMANDEVGEGSINKPLKMKCVKIEKDD